MASSSRGITEEQVWSVCDSLFAKGIVVTQEKVRAELKTGSFSTISKHVRAWKERPDADITVKNYPMSEGISKIFEESNQLFWDGFCSKYELINENEIIARLEKEVETLQDKLEIANQDSIRLQEVERIRKEQSKQLEAFAAQQRLDAVRISDLERIIDHLT